VCDSLSPRYDKNITEGGKKCYAQWFRFFDLFTYMRGIYLIKIKIPGQENKKNIHFKA